METPLKGIDANIYEFTNIYEYNSFLESFQTDSSHEVLESAWKPNKQWGFMIVKLG